MSDLQVKVRKGEPIAKALRRLKKKMDKEGILKSVQDKKYYKKPSELRKEELNARKRRRR
jgi:small subunit ribosomal protein S21